MRAVAIQRVLVVGAGQMGSGIAQVMAASGRHVLLCDTVPGAVERGLEGMRRSLGKLHEKGGPAPDEVLRRVEPVEGLADADLLVEAIVEDAEAKKIFSARRTTRCRLPRSWPRTPPRSPSPSSPRSPRGRSA